MSEIFEPLFKGDSDYHNNACLNFMPDMSVGYIDGYKIAADELAIKIDETGVNQDYLVYPIVFLYRHHLELIIKSIIKSLRIILKTTEQGYPTNHIIDKLWNIAKELNSKIPDVSCNIEFCLIDHVVAEYSKFDKDSTSFRFSEDKHGQKSNPNIQHINIRHLREMIEKASGILWDIQYGIDSCGEI